MPSHSTRRGSRSATLSIPVAGLVLTCCLAAATALPSPAGALDLNGFVPEAGRLDIAVSTTVESYDEFWRGTTKRPNPPFLGEVENTSVALWMRYGLTDRLSLIANLPYVDSSGDGTDDLSRNGLQDLTALLAFEVVEATSGPVRHRVLVAAGGRTPASDYEGDSPVSIGDDSTDGLVRLVYQLEAGGFYVSQQLGYDLRGDDVPDGFPLYTELGYTAGRVTVNGFYLNYLADGGTDIGDAGFTFPGNQDETERLGAKVFARLGGPWGVFGAGYTTLDGRNSGDITGYSAGFTLSY